MKLPPIIKAIIATALVFSLFGLFIQFIFSFLNQRVNEPKLTMANFVAPFIMTIAIVVFYIQRMFSTKGLRIFDATQKGLKILSCILLALLLLWQFRFIVLYYDIKQTQDTIGLITDLFPMATGFVTTLVLILSVAKRNKPANINFQQYRQ